MKQTAVEWLIKELKDFGYYTYSLEKLCEQAKEMEKQQIIEAIAEANKSNNRNVSLNSEQYYKETFKKEKRVIPRIPPEQRVKLNEGVEPKIKKEKGL